MSDSLLATIFGLITVLFWGVGAWMLSRTGKKNDPINTNFAVQFPAALVMIPVLVFVGKELPTLAQTSTILLVSVIFTLAFVVYIKAIYIGRVGTVVPLANTYPIFLLMLSVLILGAEFSSNQILALLIVISGAVVVGYEKSRKKLYPKNLSLEVKLAISVAVMWGISNFLLNTIVGQVPWQIIYGFINIFMLILGAFLVLNKNKYKISSLKRALKNKTAILSGIIIAIGSLSLFIGADRLDSIVIIVTIASAEPLIASLMSRVFDGEVLNYAKRLGAVLIVVGIVLLNIPA